MFQLKRKKSKLDSLLLKTLHSISWSSEIPKCDFFYSAVLNDCLLLITSEKINLLNKDTFSIFIFSRIIKDKLMLKYQNFFKIKGETKTFQGGGWKPVSLRCSNTLNFSGSLPALVMFHPHLKQKSNLSLHRFITLLAINTTKAHAYKKNV